MVSEKEETRTGDFLFDQSGRTNVYVSYVRRPAECSVQQKSRVEFLMGVFPVGEPVTLTITVNQAPGA